MSDYDLNTSTGEMRQPLLRYGDRRARTRPGSSTSGVQPACLNSPPSGLIDQPYLMPRAGGQRETAAQPGRLIVGQAALQQYRQLMDAQQSREAMRGSIVELLEGGASVEPGPLTARLRRVEQRRFSAPEIERLLGARQLEELRSQLQPIVSVQLIVEVASPQLRYR
jgi:hypothetical protein